MFKLFKSKEEKQSLKELTLQKELEEFTSKYKKYFNCYAFNGKNILIYEEPKIREGELVMKFIDVNTPKGFTNSLPVWVLQLRSNDTDFLITHRNNYINLKSDLEKLGLKIVGIEQ